MKIYIVKLSNLKFKNIIIIKAKAARKPLFFLHGKNTKKMKIYIHVEGKKKEFVTLEFPI